MKNLFSTSRGLVALFALVPMTIVAQPTPRQLYSGLFEAVQLGQVYPDGKTFVDVLPHGTPTEILAAYQKEKNQPGFELKAFCQRHFYLPATDQTRYQSNVAAGIYAHLDTLWTVLLRPAQPTVPAYSSLLALPHAYVVPGGRFREVYYWDSYFTMLGLREAGRTQQLRDMADNFAYLIDKLGFVPNGNRTYYLTRSQPPFFAQMVTLLAQGRDSAQVLARYRPALTREYLYWMAGAKDLKPGQAHRRALRLPGGEYLNRYWDDSDEPREESYREDVEAAKRSAQPAPQLYRHLRAAAESGWDFSARWLGADGQLGSIRTTDFVPVDLNCLLLVLEQTLARAHRSAGETEAAASYDLRATARAAAIQRYCWNGKAGWFVDYDFGQHRPAAPRTLAGVFPLAYGVATPSQARQVAQGLQKDFLRPGGLLTSLVPSGQQWDAPNAWAPLEYLAIEGLRRYRHTALADTVAHRWTQLNLRTFQQTGKLLEKYDVSDLHRPAGGGEYPLQDGFGWTNGVLLKLLNER
ncbi:alpha,alpha-trehalase TreF [Hymenobacter sp. ASUV-10]|uniref:Alpha,alpha-trehalase TreF n=1 Tax=Hymenobacter aranciens TaxID=3063996 RepID=A0ABT9B6N3_9BACT|nr:alpha,alpha-trehalase TreF [Hymenobacter sp. ASUV-10]MDO7873812.1 alpha,alpha-trehalase TreF [Hymenobacter sp. ASUV-10]